MANILKSRPLVQVSFLALSSLSVLMAGCSGDSDDGAKAIEQVSANNTMDVKQPVATAAPKASLQTELPVAAMSAPAAVETPESNINKMVEAIQESTKVAVAVASDNADKVTTNVNTRTGKEIFPICAGCHGGHGEGGIGPRLYDQKSVDLVAKLTRYKAGEQLGPMSAMMKPMAKTLSEEEMVSVAEYVVTLK
ncbi:MAG: cytochrome c [Thiomicrorhabdus sp.]|nr:MAG: cytochrome c [Thiomicrorhabdus sp.]